MTVALSRRSGTWPLEAALCLCSVAWPASVAAQSGELRVDLGAARTLPPSGTDAVEASYLLLGLTGERQWPGGTGVAFSLMGGRPLGRAGGDWASGQLVGELWTDWSSGVNLGLGARGYAFRVGEPWVYETSTAELFPQVRVEAGRAALTVRGELGEGRSDIAIQRPGMGVRRGSHELWHRGLVAEAATPVPAGVLTAGGGVYEGRAGNYRRGFLEWLFTGPLAVRVSGEVWDTPEGVRYAGGVGVHLSLGGPWSFRADGRQGLPDPLVRAPQGLQGGGFLGLTITDNAKEAPGNAVASLGPPAGDGATVVRFSVPADAGAALEILGDFTGWEPVPMVRGGDGWTAELPVAPGTWHFGFRADGAWYVPEGVPGRVSDDWGRENATLVVPDRPDVTREGG